MDKQRSLSDLGRLASFQEEAIIQKYVYRVHFVQRLKKF